MPIMFLIQLIVMSYAFSYVFELTKQQFEGATQTSGLMKLFIPLLIGVVSFAVAHLVSMAASF